MSRPSEHYRPRPPFPTPATDRGRLILLLAVAAVVTVFTATVPLLRDWFDLRVYYGAVHTWVHHDGQVYDYRVPGTAYGFTYPPFAAVAMLPMALLGRPAALAGALLLDAVALAVVLRVLAGRAWRRPGWFGWGLILCGLALFEPLRDTVSFGQVNLLLLALVLADAWLPACARDRGQGAGEAGSRGGRAAVLAGAGIGLAAAIKLTPALFIGLLLLGRRWRAAAVATAVALAATALAALVAPGPSRFYWTEAMWDTSRVGRLDYVSNQSVQGVLARLGEPQRGVWALAVVAVLGVWAWRSRRAAAAGDWPAAFALTGLAACLVSPITWVHHLVWLLPSFAVLLRAGHARVAGALYAVLCTSVVWLWAHDASGVAAFAGSNAYTWITLGLLLWLPYGHPRAAARFLARSDSATVAAPAAAAEATAAASAQPNPLREPGAGAETAAATGEACGPCGGGVPGAALSREPTGSTRPAAPNPQSSSARASS
ncbi:glycosyltransferase 87 family protein [Streptomyces sp. NPDC028635]|uniref:glycosyltransferase 87 family protein n=1 Tax=Streptomyces sp. NPDC028635 TaxID=3154800 RepID=UPI0033D46F4A